MVERIVATISRYRMLPAGGRVGVAVSGGADSVCLLHVLRELAPRWNLRLSVVHFNHHLRGAESDGDEEFVRRMARDLGLPLIADGAELSQTSGNLEQAAREARLDFFRSLIAQGTVDRVALGHTRSDQAETVLFRLLRGSGLAGLAGILPVTDDGCVRPLLDIGRAEVELYLRTRGIPWREDSTNRDRSFARNRVRHDLLPSLTAAWNPTLPSALAHLATLAQDEEAFWEGEIDRLSGELLTIGKGSACLQASRVLRLPIAAQRRLLRRAIEAAKGDLRQIDFFHIEQLVALIGRRGGHGRLQVPGLEAIRSFDWVRLTSSQANREPPDYAVCVAGPGRYALPSGETVLYLELLECDKTSQQPVCDTVRKDQIDWGRVPGVMELRNWRVGDHYHPVGYSHDRKLKSLFQEARVPLWERKVWPIITISNRIVWTRYFGAVTDFAAGPETDRILRVSEARSTGS